MNEAEQQHSAATAIAGFLLGQIAFMKLLDTLPAERQQILDSLRSAVAANRAESHVHQLAADKLEAFLGLAERPQKHQQQ